MTSEQRLLAWLADGRWMCGSEFLDGRFYTFSQRASDVNAKQPGRIASRPCTQFGHDHKLYEYQDTHARPAQLTLVEAV